MSNNPIMKFFEYAHLPSHLQTMSKIFCDAASQLDQVLPDSAEKSAGLRKLLEAKDCFVRSSIGQTVYSQSVIADELNALLSGDKTDDEKLEIFKDYCSNYPLFAQALSTVALPHMTNLAKARLVMRTMGFQIPRDVRTVLHVSAGNESWAPSTADLERLQNVFMNGVNNANAQTLDIGTIVTESGVQFTLEESLEGSNISIVRVYAKREELSEEDSESRPA